MIARTSKSSAKSNTSKNKDVANKLVEQFFKRAGWKPFDFQQHVWDAYESGASGLVHSATGTGKTLAIWLAPILKWLRENPDPSLWQNLKPPAPRTLWITPLRALAGDTENALRRPLDDLQLPWTLASRTGDTSSSQKSKLLRKLPTALITTPESLCLMLSHERLAAQLSSLMSNSPASVSSISPCRANRSKAETNGAFLTSSETPSGSPARTPMRIQATQIPSRFMKPSQSSQRN